MFDYLSGTLSEVRNKFCVIETHGIGWGLNISTKTAAHFSGEKNVRAYTFLNMGSGDRPTMELYGFASQREREMFLYLIDISGIGPKAALSILSALTPEELAMCVLSGDAKSLTVAQGIGMKGAQKIILELKDKIAKNTSADGGMMVPDLQQNHSAGIAAEAINALVVLGYQPQVAASVVRKVADGAKDLQDLIRLALKSMGEQ